MKVVVTGSHGLIGTALTAALGREGHDVTRLIRGLPRPGEAAWDPAEGTIDAPALEGHDAVVHLAGAGLGDHRWTRDYKRKIMHSRVRGTALLAGALAGLDHKPAVLASGSAVGFYGDRGDEEVTEDTGPGPGFLAEVCRQWEGATEAAADAGIRVAHLRSGIVQSGDGGALKRLLLPFKLGAGGRFGSGRQWLSWVHIDDYVDATRFVLGHETLEGPVNMTAPNPATVADYAAALGRAVHRPAVLPTPTLALDLILGREMTREMLLGGQRVLPARLQAAGLAFRHPDLDEALEDLLPQMTPEPLDTYRAKRDFTATPEPAPDEAPQAGDKPRFVVQEHHARRLHWDFRLERDGVLVSWAVPKGLPPDPKVNHLAVHTEDHPMSYIDFEGEIPRGNYGAGSVKVWDTGAYDLIKWEPGEVMVDLHGRRVQGRYVLFQTKDDQWMIHRMDPPQDQTREPMPDSIEPMRATPGELPEAGDEPSFAFEILWDGVRAVIFGEGGVVRVQATFPELGRLGRALGSHEVVLDGEVVALGEDGQPDRQRLERRLAGAGENESARRKLAEAVPVTYMAYDLLYLDGHSIISRAYTERRGALEDLGLHGFHWQTPSNHTGDGAALLAVARQRGLPGVVAKRLDSAYRPGEQSPDWIEVRVS